MKLTDSNPIPALSSSTNKIGKGMKGDKRKPGEHLTDLQRQILMEKIDTALIAGFRPTTIQKQLAIGKNTFWRMVDKLAQETKNERLKKSDRLVALYLNRTEKLVERLETRYAQTKDPKEWILIAAQINNIVQQTADRLQSMGYLPKRVERVDVREFDMRSWCWEALNGPKQKKQAVLKETKELPQTDGTGEQK